MVVYSVIDMIDFLVIHKEMQHFDANENLTVIDKKIKIIEEEK